MRRNSLQLLFTAFCLIFNWQSPIHSTIQPSNSRESICNYIVFDMISMVPLLIVAEVRQLPNEACWSNQSHTIIISFNVRFYVHCNLSFALKHLRMGRLVAMKAMPIYLFFVPNNCILWAMHFQSNLMLHALNFIYSFCVVSIRSKKNQIKPIC